ncbi:MAG: PHA/PHB synthase family protein [Betaproteobacteria bacterium]
MDPYRPGEAFGAWADFARKVLERPETLSDLRSLATAPRGELARWVEVHQRYYRRQADLCQSMLSLLGTAVARPAPADQRFDDPAWEKAAWFDYLKQSYFLHSQWALELAELARLEGKEKERLHFFTRQYLDAIAPANFLATNPAAIEAAVASGGKSLAQGLRNLIEDVQKGRITLADESAFELGRNLAATPGAVVHENELMQLIQYNAIAEETYSRPLIIVPPCISKYYMLDLRPGSSFVRYCLAQGQQVFLISWCNPSAAEGHFSWDDYLEKGVMQGLEAALEITGARQANALGFCVGGVMLACAAAVLRSRGDERVTSVTLLASMLDYERSGELGMLVDAAYVERKEAELSRAGVQRGAEVGFSFASLRANEFIWHFVVDNYLKGKTPPAVDLLYWTSDQPNLPGRMFLYYLRNMYLENNLRVPGRLAMCGTPVDLGRIDLPAYVFGARDDHISPCESTRDSARLLGGEVRYVVGSGGHVSGVLGRREYEVNGERREGTWWTDWSAWLAPRAGEKVPAPRRRGAARYPALEPAPGRYVKVRDP